MVEKFTWLEDRVETDNIELGAPIIVEKFTWLEDRVETDKIELGAPVNTVKFDLVVIKVETDKIELGAPVIVEKFIWFVDKVETDIIDPISVFTLIVLHARELVFILIAFIDTVDIWLPTNVEYVIVWHWIDDNTRVLFIVIVVVSTEFNRKSCVQLCLPLMPTVNTLPVEINEPSGL